jgi:hypothetical protein
MESFAALPSIGRVGSSDKPGLGQTGFTGTINDRLWYGDPGRDNPIASRSSKAAFRTPFLER